MADLLKTVTNTAEKVMAHTPGVGNEKLRQLKQFEMGTDGNLTTYFGTKVEQTDVSLKAGERGPTLLNDFHGREKVSHFDHERIPERIIHARGAAAHGSFKLHTAIPELTKAGILTDTTRETPVFLRFSTVSGSRGSADSVRDVRGFAVKFYTQEGNWDIVGNNIPIFFIQDGIQFPDLVHALKPEPHNEIPQAQTAHDNAWDWLGLSPQSTAMQMWILSDRTIPRSFRMMQDESALYAIAEIRFGVHTFVLVNAQGKRTFVKFIFTPQLGTHSLVWDEALKLAGNDPDFHRRDLWNAIEAGAYPKWDFGVQIIPEEDEDKLDFDLLDSTKIVPEELYPIKNIGVLELNQNPTNYFSETEQVAFCTQHVVPGIDFSDDPLLSWRNFSYFDTQISRLGVNFGDFPINRPVCPFRVNHRDGKAQYHIPKSRTPYFPNRNNHLPPASEAEGGYKHFPAHTKPGVVARQLGPKFLDYYSQAQLFLNSMSDVEREHMVSAAQFELGKCDEAIVQQTVIDNYAKVDKDFTLAVLEGFGSLKTPTEFATNPGHKSAFLSQVEGKSQTFTAEGRQLGIYITPGFDYTLVAAMKGLLATAGVIPMVVGPVKGEVKGSNGMSINTEFTYETCRSIMFDGVFFVGAGNDESMNSQFLKKGPAAGRLRQVALETYKHKKPIFATGNTIPWLANVALAGEFSADVTSSSNEIKQEKGVVFIPSVGFGVQVGQVIQESLSKHRVWDRDVDAIPA